MLGKSNHIRLAHLIIATIVVSIIAYAVQIIPTGTRKTGVVENIHGIPFPNNNTTITEELAHTDIYLKEPVAFKKINLSITFDPKEEENITVGIRENSFWLSYPQFPLYNSAVDNTGPQTKQITIPLTDKFQEPDRSIDLMFFTSSKEPNWELQQIVTETQYDTPTTAEIKNYLSSILKKERAQ